MSTEGAGGLGTAAIEWCIDGWDEQRTGDGQAEKARAQLAALVAAAQRSAALAAALRHIVGYYAGASEDDLPFAVILAKRALEAEAGPGAAGGRDETAACEAFMAWLEREGLSVCAWAGFDAERRVAEQAPGEWRPLGATAVLARRRDAPRAGGAGDKGAADGGADGG